MEDIQIGYGQVGVQKNYDAQCTNEYKTVKSPTNMIEFLKMKRLEERRLMVEELRRKRKLPIVKKQDVLPDMETLIEQVKSWNEQHPNYFENLEE